MLKRLGIPRLCECFGVDGFGMVLQDSHYLLCKIEYGSLVVVALTRDATERSHAVISRRQIYIGKAGQCPQEYFGVARFSMTLLDEPQLAVQDEVWTK